MNIIEENDSTFNIYRIGPRLAELLSVLENNEYYCRVANYHAVIWDWKGYYSYYIDSIDESCFVLTDEDDLHPTYAENICASHNFDSPREDSIVCLGINDYNHDYKDYVNIKNGKISFYDYTDNDKKRLVKLPYEDIMYEYIDMVIRYMKENNNYDLTIQELKTLLTEFLSANIKLKREKNV